MSEDHVSDSTDWISTSLASLAQVEAALRCQVCKDFYKTPMITACCHTFCSICIRRALSSDGRCPVCRSPEQELKLRSNWSMEETVTAFSQARESTLRIAREFENVGDFSKRKFDDNEATSPQESHPKRMRTSARLSRRRTEDVSTTTAPEREINDTTDEEAALEDGGRETGDRSRDDKEYTPGNEQKEDSFVPCPMCQRKMKAWQVFPHLENCPGPGSEPSPGTSSIQTQQSRQRGTLERVPAINYSMLKDQALRRKLAELGISSQGPRAMLERRHKEWITLWNANCDAAQPKKRSQILHDLEIWEKAQGFRTASNAKGLQPVPVKDKNFDGAAWAVKHDASFKDLIASARRNKLSFHKSNDGLRDETTGGSSTQPRNDARTSLQTPSGRIAAAADEGQLAERRQS